MFSLWRVAQDNRERSKRCVGKSPKRVVLSPLSISRWGLLYFPVPRECTLMFSCLVRNIPSMDVRFQLCHMMDITTQLCVHKKNPSLGEDPLSLQNNLSRACQCRKSKVERIPLGLQPNKPLKSITALLLNSSSFFSSFPVKFNVTAAMISQWRSLIFQIALPMLHYKLP